MEETLKLVFFLSYLSEKVLNFNFFLVICAKFPIHTHESLVSSASVIDTAVLVPVE